MQISLEGHYSYSRLIRSAVPSVVMMIVISIYSIVDGLFVSNLVGTTAFAALNVIWPALAVVGAFGLMIGTGGSALVSKTLGEKIELRNLLRRSLKLLLALGAIMVIVSEVLAVPASRLFVGYDSALTDLTVFAMRIYMPSVLLSGITLFSSGWFTGLGNGPVSALISFCRMFVFELGLVFLLPALFGMTGIWFATDVAEILSLFLCIILILRYRERYGY